VCYPSGYDSGVLGAFGTVKHYENAPWLYVELDREDLRGRFKLFYFHELERIDQDTPLEETPKAPVTPFEFGDKVRFKVGTDTDPYLFIKRLSGGGDWLLVISEAKAVAEAYREVEMERVNG
jgi:hypothetical protein